MKILSEKTTSLAVACFSLLAVYPAAAQSGVALAPAARAGA